MAGRSLRAVVFDFDGLLVDSETSIYALAASVLAQMGHHLSIEQWAGLLGHGPDDSWAALCRAVGEELDREEYQQLSDAQDRTVHDTLPLVGGATELLDELDRARVPYGVASSSSARWVVGHLERLGVADRFATIATRDRVDGRSKPAPDVYLLACADLGVEPATAVAVEDSAPGIAAARAAGMSVVAVPSHITRHTDLSAAHHTVESLLVLSVPDLDAVVRARATPAADDAS